MKLIAQSNKANINIKSIHKEDIHRQEIRRRRKSRRLYIHSVARDRQQGSDGKSARIYKTVGGFASETARSVAQRIMGRLRRSVL